MKKSNVIIGIFIAIIFIVLTVVLLACAVFVVRNISVESAVASEIISEDDIISSSGLKIGKSIVSINKSKIISSVEKENPYVRVLDVVRKFPDKIVIKVTVRTAIMSILAEDSTCAVIADSSLKVLDVISLEEHLSSGATKIEGYTFSIPEEGVRSLKGTTLDYDSDPKGVLLRNIAQAAEDPSLDLSGASFLTFFKRISIRSEENSLLALIETNTGVTLVLDTSLSIGVYEQLYMCTFVYTSDQVEKDLTKGYIALDKNSSTIAYKWMEDLD